MIFFTKKSLASNWKLVISCIGGLALIVFSSFILFEATKATVVLAQDGEKQTVRTHSNTVEDLLNEVDIEVGQHDKLSYDLNTKIKNGMDIEYKQAKNLYLTVDGIEQEFYTTADTIDGFFESEKVNISKHDDVSQQLNTQITDGIHVDVVKAFEVKVSDGEEKATKLWATGGSIEELLNENEIELKKNDKVKPAINKRVKDNMSIAITRVEKTKDTVEEKLAFSVEKKNDNSLEKGKEKVITEGKAGLVEKEFEITTENGKEVSRELLNEKVKEKSKNEVVAVGTKEDSPQLTTLASNDKGSSKASTSNVSSKSDSGSNSSEPGGKEYYMEATAFTADCSGCSGYTATGINLKDNPNMKVIAVDPNVIPLGSKVWVEGYGHAIAGDTGGAIKGNKIDAHVPSKQAANSFGRKKVKVKIVQ